MQPAIIWLKTDPLPIMLSSHSGIALSIKFSTSKFDDLVKSRNFIKSSFRRKPESRVPGENRDPIFEMVPDFGRDDVWMPPYQVRGRLLKSGMTEKAVYG